MHRGLYPRENVEIKSALIGKTFKFYLKMEPQKLTAMLEVSRKD